MFGRKKDKRKPLKGVIRKKIAKEGFKTQGKAILGQIINGFIDSIPMVRSTIVAIQSKDGGVGNIPYVRLAFAIMGVIVIFTSFSLFAKGLVSFDQLMELIGFVK